MNGPIGEISRVMDARKFPSLCRSGNVDLLRKILVENDIFDVEYGMWIAAERGHLDVVKLMIEYGANNYDIPAFYAARQGHMDIVGLMANLGINDYDQVLLSAAVSGNISMVQYIITLGARNYDNILKNYCQFCSKEVLDLLNTYKQGKTKL